MKYNSYQILFVILFVILILVDFQFFVSLAILMLLIGMFFTLKIQRDPRHQIFLKGTVPNPPLDGLYQGNFVGAKVSWRGKKLDAQNSKGINIFDDGKGGQVQKYPFKTYTGKGLLDKNLDVLKIDYDVEGNPFWLRFIVDELVQIGPNEYLGKMQVKLVPGFPFSILYFELKK